MSGIHMSVWTLKTLEFYDHEHRHNMSSNWLEHKIIDNKTVRDQLSIKDNIAEPAQQTNILERKKRAEHYIA